MVRRFGRPVGNTDSLSFLYYTDTRDRRPTTTFDVNHDGKEIAGFGRYFVLFSVN